MSNYEGTFASDFDGTIARTFERSSSGVGVNEAYEFAVQETFGDRALSIYKAEGGLRNRSPGEVVLRLQNRGFRCHEPTASVTEELVVSKMNRLTREVGKPIPGCGALWPRLTPGFHVFWRLIKKEPRVRSLVLSSGHTPFILKTFEVYGLEPPDLLVTDDETRRHVPPLTKPDEELLTFAEQMGGGPFVRPVYVGDDPEKDGQFATNCDMPFYLFLNEGVEAPFGFTCFRSWIDLPGKLVEYWGLE